ncbi:MAG TPA: protein kinase [Gemmatimonadales bacterium]
MNDLQARLETALGDAYRIERELGGGGMSRVFLAEEVDLGRAVVIKVLPPEMAAGVNQDRFRREIQLAARLQHPHIVPVHSTGSSGDLLWYVMPYIKGESLRAKLAREGELPVGEAIRILREVTDALAYAHAEGVVHRDIKPDNVMLSGSHALVTDFGVAKAVTASSGAGTLTSLGMAIGTPAYMAPEQAAGDPHVDHRADLYALGAMGYEMLAGRPPFAATSPQAMLGAHLSQAPDPLRTQRAAVPPALEALVMRCLEKRPADRWQRASDLLPQLDALLTPSGDTAPAAPVPTVSSGTEAALRKTQPIRVAVLFALAAMLVLSGTWWLVQRLGLPDWVVTGAGVLLLLGLPVVLVAARRERQRLLAHTRGVSVATPSTLAGKLLTLRGAVAGGGLAFGGLAIGTALFMGLRVLGIGPFATLVSAGVLRERDRLVVAEFENSTSDSALGSSITEALRIDLAQSAVVRPLEGRDISAALQRMQREPGARLDATLAQEVAQREGAAAVVAGEIAPLAGGFVLSVRLVSATDGSTLLAGREIARDPSEIIPAVERLSKRLRRGIGESLRSIRASEPLERVTTSSLEALRLYTQANQATVIGRRPTDAIRLLEQAIALDSGFAMAWRRLSVTLGNTGLDPDRADGAARRAHELRERLPRREAALATAFYFHRQGRRPEAIRAYQELLASWPDEGAARNNLALLLNQEGRHGEAVDILQPAIDSGTTLVPMYDNLLDARLFARELEPAEQVIRSFTLRFPEAHAMRRLFRFRLASARFGHAEAMQFLDSLAAERDPTWAKRGNEAKADYLRMLGRLREAEQAERRALEHAEQLGRQDHARAVLNRTAGMALAQGMLLGEPEGGIRRLDAALREYPLDSLPAANRPYAFLAFVFAELDRGDRAEALVDGYLRVIPASKREVEGDVAWAEATVATVRDRWREAIDGHRTAARRWGCRPCNLVQIGYAFERLDQPDSAVASYERYLAQLAPYPIGQDFDLPVAYRRLGELYELKGDRAKAVEYYGRFVDLWKDADPELQPRVQEVRRRIVELAGEPRA